MRSFNPSYYVRSSSTYYERIGSNQRRDLKFQSLLLRQVFIYPYRPRHRRNRLRHVSIPLITSGLHLREKNAIRATYPEEFQSLLLRQVFIYLLRDSLGGKSGDICFNPSYYVRSSSTEKRIPKKEHDDYPFQSLLLRQVFIYKYKSVQNSIQCIRCVSIPLITSGLHLREKKGFHVPSGNFRFNPSYYVRSSSTAFEATLAALAHSGKVSIPLITSGLHLHAILFLTKGQSSSRFQSLLLRQVFIYVSLISCL